MRTIKSLMLAISLFATTTMWAQNEAIDFALSMGMGWNYGNNLDAHYDGVAHEDGWGNKPATQKTFDAVAKAGFKTVRIPVTWLGTSAKHLPIL